MQVKYFSSYWLITTDEMHVEKFRGAMNCSSSTENTLALFMPVLIQTKFTVHSVATLDIE